jgi:hypothetical protein
VGSRPKARGGVALKEVRVVVGCPRPSSINGDRRPVRVTQQSIPSPDGASCWGRWPCPCGRSMCHCHPIWCARVRTHGGSMTAAHAPEFLLWFGRSCWLVADEDYDPCFEMKPSSPYQKKGRGFSIIVFLPDAFR